MKLKHISDQELVRLIKKGNQDVMVTLFERNFLDAKLRFEKFELSDNQIAELLAGAVGIIWQFFSQNNWKESKHKVDFMLSYVLNKLSCQLYLQVEYKQRFDFPELDNYIQLALNEKSHEPRLEVILKYLSLSKDSTFQAIGMHSFENLNDEELAKKFAFKDEWSAESKRHKALAKAINFIKSDYPVKNLLAE